MFVLGRSGANESFRASDLPGDTLAGADILHLTSQRPETAALLAKRATAEGVLVSFDPGRRLGERDYSATLDRADLVFLNDREATTVLGDWQHSDTTTVVLKHGSRGGEVRRGDERVTHPGFPVESVDTTGAGDAFAAGFLASRLRGDEDADALAVANACGALAARSVGARTALSWERIDALADY